MDNKDYEEIDEEDKLEDESDYEDELDYEDEYSNNYSSYNSRNLQNKLRDLKNNYQSQNTFQKLNTRNQNTLSKKVEASKSTSSIPTQSVSLGSTGATTSGTGAAASGVASGAGATTSGVGAAASGVASGAGAATSGAASGIAALVSNPYFWIVVLVIVVIIALIIIIPLIIGAIGDANNNSDSENSFSSNVDSMISLTKTNLTKDEFVASCDAYATKDPSHKYFYDKCGEIYDISISNKFNPEMVVVRAMVEGFSPGSSKNNYWGLGCVNNAGLSACISYSSFSEGVKGFIKNVSQYDTVEEMMGKYAYIGKHWYNPGSSSNGGCYYFPYIKQYMSSGRILTVEKACSKDNKCSGEMCEPTSEEDQLAYSKWQVSKMVSVGKNVFGSVTSQKATPLASSSSMPTSVADLKERYYFIFDKESYLNSEKNNDHLFGQCVWYAKHRAMDIVNSSNLSDKEKQKRIKSIKMTNNDGGKYVTEMESSVFKKTNNINDIKAPAVISWENKSYGHVAIVEEIKTDSKGNKVFVISEGWRTKDCAKKTDWCTHNDLESLWAVTNFNSYQSSSVSTYSSSYSFVNAASLLE